VVEPAGHAAAERSPLDGIDDRALAAMPGRAS